MDGHSCPDNSFQNAKHNPDQLYCAAMHRYDHGNMFENGLQQNIFPPMTIITIMQATAPAMVVVIPEPGKRLLVNS